MKGRIWVRSLVLAHVYKWFATRTFNKMVKWRLGKGKIKTELYHLCSILTLTGGGGASGILSGKPVSFCQFLWPDYSCDFLGDFNSFQLILSSHSNLVLWQEVQRLRGQAYYWRRRVGRISIWTNSDGLRHFTKSFFVWTFLHEAVFQTQSCLMFNLSSVLTVLHKGIWKMPGNPPS